MPFDSSLPTDQFAQYNEDIERCYLLPYSGPANPAEYLGYNAKQGAPKKTISRLCNILKEN
jgi:hypothetical protein